MGRDNVLNVRSKGEQIIPPIYEGTYRLLNIIPHSSIRLQLQTYLPEISLLVFGFMHFYKKYVPLAFCSQLLLFLNPMRTKFPYTSSLPFFLFCFCSLLYRLYPPFLYRICFTFSVSSSSLNIRLTLFLVILLPSNFRTRRYRYSSMSST